MTRLSRKAKKQEKEAKKPKSALQEKLEKFSAKVGAKRKKLKHSSSHYKELGKKYRFWALILDAIAGLLKIIEWIIGLILSNMVLTLFVVLLIIILIIIITMGLDLDSARCICDEVLIYTKDGKPVTQQTHGNIKVNSTQPSLGRTNYVGQAYYDYGSEHDSFHDDIG